MKYNEAYSKIIEAYFRDEINPADPHFCFCGNLCGNTPEWFSMPGVYHNDSHGYKGVDFVRMEAALFRSILDETGCLIHGGDSPEYEQDLFNGMSAALDVLKEIHRSRGENVDEDIPVFTQRKLEKAL